MMRAVVPGALLILFLASFCCPGEPRSPANTGQSRNSSVHHWLLVAGAFEETLTFKLNYNITAKNEIDLVLKSS